MNDFQILALAAHPIVLNRTRWRGLWKGRMKGRRKEEKLESILNQLMIIPHMVRM
jgi:hypothetical protein